MMESSRENPILVGLVLGRKRAERGLTLDELSEKAGVTWESISDVENGRELPSHEWLTKVASGLGVGITAEGLLDDADKVDMNEEIGALVRNFALAKDTTNLRKILEFVKGLEQEEKSESTNGWSLRWGIHNGYITGRSDRETIHDLSSLEKCRERAEVLKRELESGYHIWFMVAVSPNGEMNSFHDLTEPYKR